MSMVTRAEGARAKPRCSPSLSAPYWNGARVPGPPAEPLAPADPSFFKARFDADLSGVRIHHDNSAEVAARPVEADSYDGKGTYGSLLQRTALPTGSSSSSYNRHPLSHAREYVAGAIFMGSQTLRAYGVAQKAQAFASIFATDAEVNAARHLYWQAATTMLWDAKTAHHLAELHEDGSRDPVDSWIDRYNNHIGRAIGAHASSISEIELEVAAAIASERAVLRPDDPRVPEHL